MAKLKAHPIFSKHSIDSDEAKAHLGSDKFTPEEYTSLLGGGYEAPDGYSSSYERERALKEHPHNTEENNDAAMRLAQKLHSKADEGDRDTSRMEEVASDYPLSKEMIQEIIDNPDDYPGVRDELHGQKNLSKEHLMSILGDSQTRNHLSHKFLQNHNAADEEVIGKYLKNGKLDDSKQAVSALAHNPNLTEDQASEILENHFKPQGFDEYEGGHERHNGASLNNLMEKLPEEERKRRIDDAIGLSGGRHYDQEKAASPEENWDNWVPGSNHDRRMSEALARTSKHLTEDQIEHIKRHGSAQDKIALFNNEHVDPKHGAEMWQKWYNEDDHHGYDQKDLKDHLRDVHGEDFYDHYGDDARNEVEERYPMSQYLNDIGHSWEPDDEQVHEKLPDHYDWTGENPDFNPKLPEDENDNPKTINFADSRHYSPSDHPDFDERFDKLKEEMTKENQENPDDGVQDRLYEGYDDSIRDDVYDRARELYDEDAESFHEDEDRLPSHLKGHIPQIADAKRLKQEREAEKARIAAEEERARLKEFLGKRLPKSIPEEHAYADGQHHMEMAKDYADANGGAIDVGTLNKIHPNLKDKWKEIFGGKGKISSQEIQQKIEQAPKLKYNISHGKWGDRNMQNINGQDQTVFRLDHSDDSVAPLKEDPEAYNMFQKINELSQRSGHPTNKNTIAWARVDNTDPKHWMVDEVQSDFSSAARQFLEEHGKKDEAKGLDKVIEHHKNWREALLNHIIKVAKENGVEKISTHSPESKAAHTYADTVHSVYKDSYQKVPRQLGFKPDTFENLPLTDSGKQVFQRKAESDTAASLQGHNAAAGFHRKLALEHEQAAREKGGPKQLGMFDDEATRAAVEQNPEHVKKHLELAEHHRDLASKHINRGLQIDPTHSGLKKIKFSLRDPKAVEMNRAVETPGAEADLAATKPHAHESDKLLEASSSGSLAHMGHTLDLRPPVLKKALEVAERLIKAEEIVNAFRMRLAI
jgi:hypothetical protein